MHSIRVRNVSAQPVVTKRARTTYAGLRSTMHSAITAILGTIDKTGGTPAGAPFAVYHVEPFSKDRVDVEIGIPVPERLPIRGEAGQPRISVLPGGTMAWTIHVGPYSGLPAAYEELDRWISEHGYEAVAPPRERYIIGPESTHDPRRFRTEIDVPIAPLPS